MKTILVTGGAGFIGSHLVKKYLDEGHKVICIDNLQTTGDEKNIKSFLSHPRFRFIRHDIIEPFPVYERLDWIFNFACSGSYTSYQFNPVHTVKTNTAGVINVLDLARKNNARVLQASTSEIYGDPLETPQKETYKGNVNSLGPRACYDEGKRCAETLCMDYHREYGLDVKIIRIFNTYGPNMDPEDGRAVTNFITRALAHEDIIIYGDGSNTRSFQYIDDLIEGIDRMMRKDAFVGPVNLGNPGEITMKDLAEKVIKATDSTSKVTYDREATDDPKRRCPDISLAKERLGWQPDVGLDEGLQHTIDYFKSLPKEEKRILVFTVSYDPLMGPAEEALRTLIHAMPDVHFDIITAKMQRGLSSKEKKGNETIVRVGMGARSDKYLLPILGYIAALKRSRRAQYHFIWSVMASYGGVAALFFRLTHPRMPFLVSLDDTEMTGRRSKLLDGVARTLLSGAERTYVSDTFTESPALLSNHSVERLGSDAGASVTKIRYLYADILNHKRGKLSRAK